MWVREIAGAIIFGAGGTPPQKFFLKKNAKAIFRSHKSTKIGVVGTPSPSSYAASLWLSTVITAYYSLYITLLL